MSAPLHIQLRSWAVQHPARAALAALSFYYFLAAAQAEAIFPRVQIVERGIYRAETVLRADPSKKGVVVNTVQSPRLIASTTLILAEVGVRFGLRYIAVASPGHNPELKLVIRFPPGGLRDVVTGQILFQSELNTAGIAGVTHYWEYHLEHGWEVVSGIWTFEFWHQGKKLAEQQFCVQKMKSMLNPDLAMGCGFGLFR